MQKKRLLLIIDNLTKGGAEVLLVGILPELNIKFDVYLVTLTNKCEFKEEAIICKQKFVLGFKGKSTLISGILKLKKIIHTISPSVIHTHLFYSSLLGRLACSPKIPLLYTVHNELSKDIFNKNPLLKFIEKTTIRKNHSVIAVSKLVLDDYAGAIHLTKKHFILKNYIADEYLIQKPASKDFNQLKTFKIIAVGNLKESKNYEYLIESFIHLKNDAVSLDIYGNYKHPLYPKLNSLIAQQQLPVAFKGQKQNMQEIICGYDLYIMSSKFEGFGIAAVEAMSAGLPVLLSDIPVLREVSYNNALFFDINDPLALATLIKQILAGKHPLNKLSEKGIEIARNYSRQKYIDELYKIYDTILGEPVVS